MLWELIFLRAPSPSHPTAVLVSTLHIDESSSVLSMNQQHLGGALCRVIGLPAHNRLVVGSNPAGPTRLDEIKSLHSTDSIDTENSGTRGRSIWVHSRLLDSSVPAGEGGAVGNGVARSLGTEPG